MAIQVETDGVYGSGSELRFDEGESPRYTESTMTKTVTENKNLDDRIRSQVIDVMREVLSDPDAGLEVTPEFSGKLKESMKAEEAGKTTPLEKIFEKYGV